MTQAEIEMLVQEDRRSDEWRALHAERASLLASEVALGRRLARWVSDGRVFDSLAGSLSEFGGRLGIGPQQVRWLVSVGMLLEQRPDLEARLLEGDLNLESADLLWQVHSVEGAVRDGEDWAGWACAQPTADFRKRVDRRLAELAAGGPVRHLGFFVSRETARDFRRARVVASWKEKRPLSNAETLGIVVADYLRRHDPAWAGRRHRRVRRPFRSSDSIPEAEKRAVRARFGDRCAVDGCTNEIHLEFAHIRARALGGPNTAANLLLLYSRHHRMFDAKRIDLRHDSLEGTVFVDRDGKRIANLRGPPGAS